MAQYMRIYVEYMTTYISFVTIYFAIEILYNILLPYILIYSGHTIQDLGITPAFNRIYFYKFLAGILTNTGRL